jgi:rare lipoprotein A
MFAESQRSSIVSALKNMNQHRLTCLSTVVITAFLAPIATVCSKTLPAQAVESVGNTSPGLPRSLPIITPLTVTELETDVAIPTASTPTPQPNRPATASTQQQIEPAPIVRSSVADPQFVSTLPRFDSTVRVTTPVFSESTNFTDLSTPIPGTVKTLPPGNTPDSPSLPNPGQISSLPSPTPSESTDTEAIKIRAVSPSVLVMRSAGSQFRAIISASTIEAEIAGSTQVRSRIAQTTSSSDNPSFVTGVPTFSFDNDRPQQIVATTTAEIGTTQSTQTSVSIPVDRSEPLSTTETTPGKKTDKLIAYKSKPSQSILDRIVATQTGKASWYGAESGPKTANGERFNPNGLSAAHRTLPFGTRVRVTSMRTGKSVTIRINDRGPFHTSRILDLSAGAAQAIGLKQDGIGTIRMEVLAAKK